MLLKGYHVQCRLRFNNGLDNADKICSYPTFFKTVERTRWVMKTKKLLSCTAGIDEELLLYVLLCYNTATYNK